jgi:hypothetical protein
VNGQAVAQLTLRQFDREAGSISDGCVIADDEVSFENVFAKGKTNTNPEPTHQSKHNPPLKKESLPITLCLKCISLFVLNPRFG